MKIYEYQASELLKDAGIPVPGGSVAATAGEARAAAERIGFPIVLKAQVHSGGRGKAGGIRVVRRAGELDPAFHAVRGLTIRGLPVKTVFLVPAIDIAKEFYAGVTVDARRGDVVLIGSAAGGVDIEETARTRPEAIRKFYLDGQKVPGGPAWHDFCRAVFGEAAAAGAEIFVKMTGLFFRTDASLVEINPLVVTREGAMVAADAKISFDENGLFRHPELAALRDPQTDDPDEAEAKRYGLSFVKLDGTVGCIVNGAGLAMATLDIIKLSGGEPANFLDVGGSSNPEKVVHALEIILRNPGVKVILINIFGGITRCDDIAAGLLQARERIKFDAPLVVRLIGTNEEEARVMLENAGIGRSGSMREAVEKAVALSQ